MKKEFFISDNLNFVAAAILQGEVTIKKVVFHPMKQGVKNYYLTPYETVNTLYLQYTSDQLLVNPIRLAEKIASLKYLQAEMPNGGGA